MSIFTVFPDVTSVNFALPAMLMACAGLGAALLASRLPARRRGDEFQFARRRRARRSAEVPGLARNEMWLHGHRLVYRVAGAGPPLLMVHGLFEDSLTWRKVIPGLSRTHTVIAPDLFGHGESDAPSNIDYSPAGHAGTLRDLLDVLGHDRVTIIGHSLGGGIAISFAYNYPARVQRMALISSGGLGREVHPVLRTLSLPGSGSVLRILTTRWALGVQAGLAGLARAAGAHRPARSLRELRLMLTCLHDRERRAAMIRTLRSVIGRQGQCVCALDRLHLLRKVPALVLWGTRDRMIPVHHASALLTSAPYAELELLDGVGHLPHLTEADFVADRLSSFINDMPARVPVAAGKHVSGPGSARRLASPPVRAAEVSI